MITTFRTFNMNPNTEIDTIAYFIDDLSYQHIAVYEEEAVKAHKLTFYKKREMSEPNLIFIGTKGMKDAYDYRHLGGEVGRFLDLHGIESINFKGLDQSYVPSFIEGIILGTNYQDAYKKNRMKQVLKNIQFDQLEDAEIMYQEIFNKTKATLLARNISNAPLNEFNAEHYANTIVEVFKDLENVKVEVLGRDELVEKQFNGILTVSKGTHIEPKVIVLTYQTNPNLPLTALVGKGITFDMGGYNIKNGRDLSGSRVDMGGSAAVFGAIYELAIQKKEANIVGIILATENLISSEAMVPGDVIKYRNGLSVQVANTDAEGRLLLADGLLYAQELGATHIIDIATLTGAIGAALGTAMAGFFTNDSELRLKLNESANVTGERIWEFPLIKDYEKSLESQYADLSNLSSLNHAGHITAALFLQKFVDEKINWAHLDIAAMTDVPRDIKDYVAGMTGYGVKLLAEAIERIQVKG